jgi:hypothetical protein
MAGPFRSRARSVVPAASPPPAAMIRWGSMPSSVAWVRSSAENRTDTTPLGNLVLSGPPLG